MNRPRWASRTTFILAAVGSAVGLGNVWRFPYLAYKYGGGAFLVPYLVALVLIGVPVLMLEFGIGQRFQKGAVHSFRELHPRFAGLGVFALLSAFIIVCYYAVVMAWALIYFFASFTLRWKGDASGFFYDKVLQIAPAITSPEAVSLNLVLVLALAAVWVLIYFCVWKGVHSVGKVVAWTVPLPVLLLALLLARAAFLPGALSGWWFYLVPKWGALLDPEVWQAAFSQILFTLTIGFGVMIAYASYNKKDEDVVKNAWVTALINSGISVFAGFVVFAVLGFMAHTQGTSVGDVVASGPGLAFVVFPQALSLFGKASAFFAALFFLTLLSLGIDSAFSLVEAVNAALKDWSPKLSVAKLSAIVSVVGFLGGLIFTTRGGLYFLDIVDHFVNNYNLVLVVIFQSVLVGWVHGADKHFQFLNAVSEWRVGAWWKVSIRYVVPVLLSLLVWVNLFLKKTEAGWEWKGDLLAPYGGYGAFSFIIGWAVVLVPLVLFVLFFIKGSEGGGAAVAAAPGRPRRRGSRK
ncbi:sodium-dependent transporter [Candidatus Woesearchaeota archaeon]|nr:MAG: sodium-dependent transporter [Candidatus Woesearchaeota archaeon]